MRSLVAISIIVAIATAAAPARAKDACVSSGEVKPVVVPEDERALVQEQKCAVITKKDPPDPKKWADCPKIQKLVASTHEFCKDPLAAKEAVSGADIEATRAIIESDADCGLAKAGVTRQTDSTSSFSAQSAILQGLANFIVARAKAEAMAFLIEHLDDQICGSADGKALFPASCEVLGAKPGGNAWGTLKVAFEADMERLPERALACAAKQAGGSDTVQTLVYDAAQTARLIYQKNDPMSVIAGFRRDDYTAAKCTQDRAGCALHVLGFTVQLLSPRDNSYRPKDEVYFAKLVVRRWLEELVKLQLVNAAWVAELEQDAQRFNVMKDRLLKLKQDLQKLADASGTLAKGLETASTPELKLAAIAKALRATIGFLDSTRDQTMSWLRDEFARDAPTVARLDELDRKAKVALTVALDALDAYDKIAAQKYAHVYVAVALGIEALKLTNVGKDLDDKIRKLMPFIADVAAAKTADDVQRSLEAAAAPIGGGLAKRGSNRRTVALTGFAGVTAGGELAFPTSGTSNTGGQAGLFVPVGFDVSWGLSKIHSLGFFASVIDLGAIANFRTEEAVMTDGMKGKLENGPQIGIEQVVSPGLYFVWGVDRFAFGFGGSMTPSLRNVTAAGSHIDSANAFRFGVFAAIDVTIFPF